MPEIFGAYELVRLLGRGGMGEVYEAVDRVRGRTVALKVLPQHLADDEGYKARFRRESQLAATLHDPHIIPIHDFGEIDGRLFIDMRLVHGVDLANLIEHRGRLSAAAAVKIVSQIASALDSANECGLVHRDVKPSNILLSGIRDTPQFDAFAYLVDFGLARSNEAAGTRITSTGMVGTIAYSAPERIAGEPGDVRSDVYALACVLYEIVTGSPPFTGEPVAIMYAHMHADPPDLSLQLPDVPHALAEVVRKGMAKAPDDRYQSAEALTADAAAALAPAVADASGLRHDAPSDTRATVIVATPESMGTPPQPPRAGTLTLLMTEIDGSAQWWDKQPDQMDIALRRRDELMRRAIEHAGGYVFKAVGDAFCAVFPTAPQAATAAQTAQHALAAEAWPAPVELRVRMALHTGHCEERGGDYFGPVVNRAARLGAIAHGGQILLSHVTAELLAEELADGVQLRNHGEHRLQDLGRPEHVYQLVTPGLQAEFPPLRSLEHPDLDNNLPTQLSSFIGREKEIDAIEALVEQSRLVTLTGVGGAGKTRLALAAAARLLDGSGDGVWFVDLAPLVDARLVAAAVASVLGVRDETDRPIDATVLDALATRRLLLVLDNCEHVLERCVPLADQILRRCPQVQLLATSRHPLGITGEQLYHVPPLQLPTDESADAESSEAVQLFLDRARDQQPGFALNGHTRAVVARLCRRLDGMPLAIELACGRLRLMTVDDIETRLDERFRLLTGGSRTALPRQQTLRALIDWSFELLTEQEQAAFVRLAVFAGSFDLSAAERVCASDSVDVVDVLDILGSLVDKSLVQASQVGDSARFRLLETVREYAAETLRRDADGLRSARDAHAGYFLDLVEHAAPRLVGGSQEEWLAKLEAEYDNLRAATVFLHGEDGSTGRALRFGVALDRFWTHVGHSREGLDLIGAALALPDSGEPGLRAAALAVGAHLALQHAELPLAQTLLEEGLGLAEASGKLETQARCLAVRASVAFERGEYETAFGFADEAVDRARRSGDSLRLAHCLRSRGDVASSLDLKRAVADLTEALTYFREAGSRADISIALTSLGVAELEQRELESASEHLHEAITQAPPGSSTLYYATLNLGFAVLMRGDAQQAMTLFAAALTLHRGHGMTGDAPFTLLGAALSLSAVGEHEAAAALHGAADAALDGIGMAWQPLEANLRDQDWHRLRDALGAESFESTYTSGRRTRPDEALELALQQLQPYTSGTSATPDAATST